MICREWSLVHYDKSGTIGIPLTCRSWGCAYCGPNRRRDLVKQAMAGNPNRFITLTVSPAIGGTPITRAAALANAWRLVVKRAGRQLKIGKIEYLAVFEKTKRGEPHLHILARCGYIDQRWLSAQMKQLIGAPIVDIRKVDNPRKAAAYVAKYIGKDPHRFGNCKRYWSTKGWVTGTAEQAEPSPWADWQWSIVERSTTKLVQEWVAEGRIVDFEKEFDTVWVGAPPPWLGRQPPEPPNSG